MAKRIVVKVGSGYIFERNEEGFYLPRSDQISGIAYEVSELSEEHELMIVSSGAIATAAWKQRLNRLPDNDYEKAMLSEKGQPHLMEMYISEFEKYGKRCAQCLITKEDLEQRKRRRNLRRLQEWYFLTETIRIYNENDSMCVSEISFGDNDILSAHLAKYMDADLLVMLSCPQEGLGFGGDKSKKMAREMLNEEGITLEIINKPYERDESGIFKPVIRFALGTDS